MLTYLIEFAGTYKLATSLINVVFSGPGLDTITDVTSESIVNILSTATPYTPM